MLPVVALQAWPVTPHDVASRALPIEVLQACERGRNDWVGPPGSDAPAPVLRIEPAAPAGHHH